MRALFCTRGESIYQLSGNTPLQGGVAGLSGWDSRGSKSPALRGTKEKEKTHSASTRQAAPRGNNKRTKYALRANKRKPTLRG
eukprot:5071257-Amphidinium_carterae.1